MPKASRTPRRMLTQSPILRRIGLDLALLLLILIAWGSGRLGGRAGDSREHSQAAPQPVPGGHLPNPQVLEVVERFECGRCHEDAGTTIPPERACAGCHRAILEGTFDAPPDTLHHWQSRIQHFVDLPRLHVPGKKLRKSYLREFLTRPHDVRPALAESMPTLFLSPREVELLSEWLGGPDAEGLAPQGDVQHGSRLFVEKGCAACHIAQGRRRAASVPPPVAMEPGTLARGVRLAPDLAYASTRLTVATLRSWISDPQGLDPASAMPHIPLTEADVENIVAYLLSLRPPVPPVESAALAALRLPEQLDQVPRLPVLERPVYFDEVRRTVLRRVCWHCHSDPDYAFGDGGPGNTGGFGLAGRGIALADWEGIGSGYLDDEGKRHSLLKSDGKAPPRLVAALLARRVEEAGGAIEGVRGMPLGLPSLPAHELQLIESWVSQGAPLAASGAERAD